MHITNFIFRKFNDGVRVPVPLDYSRKHGLQPGDVGKWIEEPDGTIRIKILRVEQKVNEQQGAAA